MANLFSLEYLKRITYSFFFSIFFSPKVVINNFQIQKKKTPTKHGHCNWPKYIFTYFSSSVQLTKNLCHPKITNFRNKNCTGFDWVGGKRALQAVPVGASEGKYSSHPDSWWSKEFGWNDFFCRFWKTVLLNSSSIKKKKQKNHSSSSGNCSWCFTGLEDFFYFSLFKTKRNEREAKTSPISEHSCC